MWTEWLEERVGSAMLGRAKAVEPAEEKRRRRWEDVMGQGGGFQLPCPLVGVITSMVISSRASAAWDICRGGKSGTKRKGNTVQPE